MDGFLFYIFPKLFFLEYNYIFLSNFFKYKFIYNYILQRKISKIIQILNFDNILFYRKKIGFKIKLNINIFKKIEKSNQDDDIKGYRRQFVFAIFESKIYKINY
jgi:hypothetical protein